MLLTDRERAYLDACDENGETAVGRMLSYLDSLSEEGVSSGRFTLQEFDSDLEIALYRAFALLQYDEYLSYVHAVEVLEKARANASHSGVWHYRLAVALTHTGQLDEALDVAEVGVKVEPTYPWGWLHLGKLRAHFDDKMGALEAGVKGLELVPEDPEFLQLMEEIQLDTPLTVMMCHYIDPEQDKKLQNLQMDLKEVLDKQLALTCIIKDLDGFETAKKAFGIEKLQSEPDAPACLGADVAFSFGSVHVVFRMNEAGFSHLSPTWVKHFKAALEQLIQDGHCAFNEISELWLDLDRTVHVVLKAESDDGEARVMRFKVNGGLSNESETPDYVQTVGLSPEIRATLDRVGSLNEQDNYDEIIRMLENISDSDRHPVLTLELARAHNNASKPRGSGLQRAIELLESIKEQFEDTFEWQFRMGYALFYMDRDDEAIQYLERAEALRKGDHDSLELIRACRGQMSYPRFSEPFAKRVEAVWKTFEEKTTVWQKRLAKSEDVPAVLGEMKQVINEALPETSIAVGATEAVVEVNFSTNSNYLSLYPLRAMCRAIPVSLQKCWQVTLCRSALPSCADVVLKMGSREYAAKDLVLWESVEEDASPCLTIYTKLLEELEEHEVDDAFRAVNLLLDHAFGEVAHMKHFSNFRLSRKPEKGVGFSLPEYVRYIRETAPEKLVSTLDDYLDEPVEFQWKHEVEPNCDYLVDARRGRASCPALLSAYLRNEPEPMRHLHQAGVTAGVLFIDSQDHSELTRSKLRAELRQLLSEKVSHAYESFGEIEGQDYAYDLFFSWNLPEVIEVVDQFGESHPEALTLGFHSFFREAGALIIKKPEED